MPDPSVDDDLDLDQLDDPSNENFSNLRKYARKMEKRAKDEGKRADAAELKASDLETQHRTVSLKETAKAKGLDDEQTEMLLAFKPNATVEEVEAFAAKFVSKAPASETEEPEPEASEPQAQGFVPSPGGSHVPATPYTDEDFGRALKRGDTAAITRMAAEATKDPNKLTLKWGHLIED